MEAVAGKASPEALKKTREEYVAKLEKGHSGEECADLKIAMKLCLFDVMVNTTPLQGFMEFERTTSHSLRRCTKIKKFNREHSTQFRLFHTGINNLTRMAFDHISNNSRYTTRTTQET